MKKDDTKDDLKPMSLLSLILSFVSLFVISILLFFPLDQEMRQFLIGLDFIICSIFFLQLSIDLIRAADRKKYLKTHWIDYLASIPMIEALRFARLFHILRIILVIRSVSNVTSQLKTNRKETTLASILLLLVVLLTIGAASILSIERGADGSNIVSGSDALWWAFVTISTVGYGDHYPVTNIGKLVACVVIVFGVGIFGMISGLITSLITQPGRQQREETELLYTIMEQQDEILTRLNQIEQANSRQKSEVVSNKVK